MIIPVITILLAIILSILASSTGNEKYLKTAFFILFLFIGFRYDYGNDTLEYAQMFRNLASYDFSIFDFAGITSMDSHDPGWVWLNYLFKPIGWFGFQIVLTAFELWVIYDCTKRYVPKEFQWLSVAIFTLSPGFMWIGACSMFRQWLACILFLFSIRFILNRKLILFLLVNIAGCLCHKSAIIVLPAYIFTYLNLDFIKKKITAVVILILLAVWYSVAGKYFGFLDAIMMDIEDFSKYAETYTESLKLSYSIIGFVTAFAMPAFVLFNIDHIDKKFTPLIFISFCSLLVTPLTGYMMMIGRLSTYFQVINIVLYPKILSDYLNKNSENKIVVTVMILIILLPCIRALFGFFGGGSIDAWAEHYTNYNTIFSQPWQ